MRFCATTAYPTQSSIAPKAVLRESGLQWRHFGWSINRSDDDAFLPKVAKTVRMRQLVEETLDVVQPRILVFAIDNDPIGPVVHRRSAPARHLFGPCPGGPDTARRVSEAQEIFL